MLCLICWVAYQSVKWVLDPAYHEHADGHVPFVAADPVADALLDGRIELPYLVLPDGTVVVPVTECNPALGNQ